MLCLDYSHSVDNKNEFALMRFIEERDNVSNISIIKQSDYENIHSILYTCNGSIKLFIMEKSTISNRYKYFDGSGGSSGFGTYNCFDSNGVLIIVYGDNSSLNASKYAMENGTVTYLENIENIDYVLRIYRFPRSFDMNSNLYLYDSNGGLIREY
ncbi:MAG TPA: hypothetical protein VN258_17395 [Mobilitalea sp.]|nr:hypothetical protein [Mobilitalea sp.]